MSNENTTSKKFTSNGTDSQLLQQLVLSNSIDNMSAKEVREHYPQFRDYPLNNFRVNLKRYRERSNKSTNIAEDNVSVNNFLEHVSSSVNPAGIMSRATPNTGMFGVASITPTPRNIRFSEVTEICQEKENSKENSFISRFAVPSVSAAESQNIYGSSCRELVNKYLIIPWDHFLEDGYCLNRLSVMVWLPSVASLNTVNCCVSKCNWKLIVTIKNPDVFNLDYVDTLLEKFYKDAHGRPMYPPTHTRNVAHKKAVSTLPKDENGQVTFTQIIKLPFQVYSEPVPVGGYDGIQFKGLEHGTIKILVAELVPQSYGDYLLSKRLSFNDVEVDQISHSGNATLSGVATVARSYLSYNQIGKKLPPRVYGNWSQVQQVREGQLPMSEIETIASSKKNLKEVPAGKEEVNYDSISTKDTSSDSSDSEGTSSSEESRRRRKKRKKSKRAKRRQRKIKKRLLHKVRTAAEKYMTNGNDININATIPECTQYTSTITTDPNNNIAVDGGGNQDDIEVPVDTTTDTGTIYYDGQVVLQPFDPM